MMLTHSEDDCDCCKKRVGKTNLKALPWHYLNRNDKEHLVVREHRAHVWCEDCQEHHEFQGYCQYYVCDDCYKQKVKK